MPTDRDTIERAIDRSLDDFGRFLRRRWRPLLLGALVLAYILTQWVPLFFAAPPRGSATLSFVSQVVGAVLLAVGVVAALYWLLGRPRVTWSLPGDSPVTFADYKGAPDALEAARRIVTLLRGARELRDTHGEISRGLLLVGPGGTGKRYLGRLIATESGAPFGYVSAASYHATLSGLDALALRALYRAARRMAREYGACVVFMDELDAIALSRGGLNELLAQMDPPPTGAAWWARGLKAIGLDLGPARRDQTLTIGATNAPESLDAALLRPGRFDRRVTLAPPADARRGEVIEYYLGTTQHEDIALARLVSDMMGYTPLTIKHVINEAALIAHMNGRDSMTYSDISAARETHEFGARYPRALSALEKRRLAYHEAGHVIAQVSLLPRFRVAHATIIKRMGATGEAFVEAKPLEEIVTQSAEEVFARIQVSLASRAAEELFLSARLNGVGGDLANATQLALQYVAHWGMGETFFSAAATLAPERMYTDPTLRDAAEKLLREAYNEVSALIERRRKALIAVAEALLDREELDSEEIERLIREAEAEPQPEEPALMSVAASALGLAPSFAPPALLGGPPSPPPASVDAIPAPPITPARLDVRDGRDGRVEREGRDRDLETDAATGNSPRTLTPPAEASAPAPAAFTAAPSRALRGDRVVDRALQRGPRLTRPIARPTAPLTRPRPPRPDEPRRNG